MIIKKIFKKGEKMSTLLKTFSAVLALCGALSCFAAPAASAPKAVPGAALYIYQWTDAMRPTADADPVAVIVDTTDAFSQNNVNKNAETAKFWKQHRFMVWQGYVSIPANGNYTWSLSFDKSGAYHSSATNVIVQINKKDFLGISKIAKKRKENDVRSLTLAQGDYEITVIMRAPNSYHEGYPFTLKMWNSDGIRMTQDDFGKTFTIKISVYADNRKER